VQLRPLTLRSICPVGGPKVQQLEKRLHCSNSAARGQLAFRFHGIVLYGTVEAAELSKPTKGRIRNGIQRLNFSYTDPDITGTAKARDFKFGVCINHEV